MSKPYFYSIKCLQFNFCSIKCFLTNEKLLGYLNYKKLNSNDIPSIKNEIT